MTAARIRLWPSLSPAVYARRPASPPPFPLAEPGVRLFARGRQALHQGVASLGLAPGDEVLTPAYHCGTEVAALLEAGLRCRYYEATETLAPDPAELERLLGERTRALLLIHYFGFPQDAAAWRTWCDARGLALIEDCAHAALATTAAGGPAGSYGDLAVFSLYKTLPLPDGGALLARVRPPAPEAGARGLGALAKRHVRWAMARSALLDARLDRFARTHEGAFAVGAPRAPAATTRLLLGRVADAGVAERRRANYRSLLRGLADRVPPAFATLPEGACPLFFPLLAEAGVAERAERAGVEARPFWPVLHPQFDAERFPQALAWHGRFVALPVHQELRSGDVERIVEAVGGHAR